VLSLCGNGDVRFEFEFELVVNDVPFDDGSSGGGRDFVLRSVGPAQVLDDGLASEGAVDRW